ncbi:MAG: hypothetical protein GX815_05855 [Clostridiales bacterium]|nr:hypothetical protein [Clostridiales bacterium]
MDAKLRYYAALKTVEQIHGKRGKTFVLRLLKGSREYNVEKSVREFDLIPLWGLLYRLDKEEVEATLTELASNGLIYVEEISSGAYKFPFLHISEEGRKELAKLGETEGKQIQACLEQACFEQKSPEVSKKGILLDHFLDQLFYLLKLWQDRSTEEVELDELIGLMKVSSIETEMVEKFIYRSTPEKLRNQFRSSYALSIVNYQLTKQIRQLLSTLPEQEANVFRCRYQINDIMFKPLIDIMKHYGLMERDILFTIKRYLARFGNRVHTDRFPFITTIMDLLSEHLNEDMEHPLAIVKDTTEVSYELYSDGLSIPEIARERGLAISTIFTHFTKLIPQYEITLQDIIPNDRIASILQAADTTGGVSLKAIREQLSSDYNYGEIKLVMELERGWKAA